MKKLFRFTFLVIAISLNSCSREDDNQQESNNTEISDADGNVYYVQLIADQHWTIDNLKTKTYRDGTPIPYVEDPLEWENLTTGAWRYVNNDHSTEEKYGLLYNFYAVNNPKGLSPKGSRIPSYKDYLHLTSYFGTPISSNPNDEIFSGFLTNDPDAPWSYGDISIIGTNSTGLNLYPAGFQRTTTSNNLFGIAAVLWSSDSNFDGLQYSPFAVRFSRTSTQNTVGTFSSSSFYGCSVRLIKEKE